MVIPTLLRSSANCRVPKKTEETIRRRKEWGVTRVTREVRGNGESRIGIIINSGGVERSGEGEVHGYTRKSEQKMDGGGVDFFIEHLIVRKTLVPFPRAEMLVESVCPASGAATL